MAKQPQVLAFNFTKINVEKNPTYNGEIAIKSNISTSSIEKSNLELVKQETLKIDFLFDLDYGELGKVNIEGFMILLFDPKTTKDVLAEWKENKKILKEIKLSVFNIILRKCSLKSLQLEEEIGLPIHMQMPRFNPEEEAKEKSKEKTEKSPSE